MARQNTILIFIFIIIVTLDQVTKSMAQFMTGSWDFLFFTFEPYFNKGISFGAFSDVVPTIRIVSLSVFFGAILLGAFIYIFYFLNRSKLFNIRLKLLTFFAGVTGNGIDRTLNGEVTDFIILKPLDSIVFNVADIFILLSGALFIWDLFHKADYIWYPEDKRKFPLVDQNFQFGFVKKLILMSVGGSLITAIFSYTVIHFILPDGQLNQTITLYLLTGFFGINIFFIIISFIFGIFMSHRYIGPIFGLSRFVDEFSADTSAEYFSREQDQELPVDVVIKKIKTKLRPID